MRMNVNLVLMTVTRREEYAIILMDLTHVVAKKVSLVMESVAVVSNQTISTLNPVDTISVNALTCYCLKMLMNALKVQTCVTHMLTVIIRLEVISVHVLLATLEMDSPAVSAYTLMFS